MILSVSERTDIPAFYSTWFYERIKAGYVDVRNPFYPKQVNRILLTPEHVDFILFTSKNPTPMIQCLDELKGFQYAFQITITPYHQDIELNVKNKQEVVKSIQFLSKKLGKEKVMLRYDPILLNQRYTIEYHTLAFQTLMEELDGYIDTCIISFIDYYKNTNRNLEKMKLHNITKEDMKLIASKLSDIAKAHHVSLQTCGEEIDLAQFDISKTACVSKEWLQKILPYEIKTSISKKREHCYCVKSVGIGDYNTCGFDCLYCYANYDHDVIAQNRLLHNPKSSLLIGELQDDDVIHVMKQQTRKQMKFF